MKLTDRQRRKLHAVGKLPDDEVGLAETALMLAAVDRPGISLGRYRRHLDQLVEEAAAYTAGLGEDPPLSARHDALVQILVKRFGYAGMEADFADLDAANLMRVIDSRSGLPVALGILFLHTADQLGWAVAGVDFPGRFLIRLEAGGERMLFDPFEGAKPVDVYTLRHMIKAYMGAEAELEPEHYREMSARQVLLRLLDNVKTRHLQGERMDKALEIVERMLLIAPDASHLWRECGLIHARLDQVKDAVASLEEYLRLGGRDGARYHTSMLLQELRARLN